MAECSECGKKTMSFTCHYCGEKFCSEHRLPENHDCDGLETGKKLETMAGYSEEDEEEEASDEKWFEDRDVKQEVKRTPSPQKRSLMDDILFRLKRNYTLAIILVTSGFFILGQMFPVVSYALMLFPNITPELLAPGLQTVSDSLGYVPSLLNQPWGLLTVLLVHGSLFHLLANMITFYFFGDVLEKAIGSKEMLKFYIGTGLVASLAFVLVSNIYYILHGAAFASGVGTLTPAVGASGAVVAAVGAVAMLYPDSEVLLYFVIPMKIQTAVKAFGVIEVINLSTKLMGTTLPVIGGFASSAHLAGLLIGLYVGKRMRDNVRKTSQIDLFKA